MLDIFSLRVAFGLVALCVLVLTYFVTYRSTRSAYSGWWTLSLFGFGPGALLYLFNDTQFQALANPLGNVATVLGAVCLWGGTRALGGRKLPLWVLVVAPLVVFIPALFDDPGTDVWPAGSVYLAVNSVLTILAAREVVRLGRQLQRDNDARMEYRRSVYSMAVVSCVFAAFYVLRLVFFVTLGPESDVFRIGLGTQTACLLFMLLMVATSFNVSILSFERESHALRERATRDALTGLFNRKAFEDAVAIMRRRSGGSGAVVLMADLDQFKGLNDGRGHQAGDRALVAFSESACAEVGDQGVVGRLGGDEFVIVSFRPEAEELAHAIDTAYRSTDVGVQGALPTVSFGIARLGPQDELADALGRADAAMYRAKSMGGSRAVREVPRPDTGISRGVDAAASRPASRVPKTRIR